VKTLEEGASGLVLAAESAVGKYPVECVRVMSRIIDEVDNQKDRDDVDYLLSLPSDRIIDPHGGKLVEQNATRLSSEQLRDLPILTIDERIRP
jgi:pyruvate kinase